jgi:hypothetical protein
MAVQEGPLIGMRSSSNGPAPVAHGTEQACFFTETFRPQRSPTDETAVRATPASLLAVPGMIIVNLTLPQKQLRQLARALVTSKSGIY